MMTLLNFIVLLIILKVVFDGFARINQRLDRLTHAPRQSKARTAVTQDALSQERDHRVSAAQKVQVPEKDVTLAQELLGDRNIVRQAPLRERHVQKEKARLRSQGWLTREWPMKVGALLVLAAVGWAVTYAFTNDIIGPVGRVSLTILFGGLLIALGTWRMRQSSTQGTILLFVGTIAVFIAMLGGIDYGFFSTTLALFAMLCVMFFVAEVGRMHRQKSFVTVVFLFASLLPALMASSLTVNVTFLYLFILSAGTIVAVVRSAWRDLLLANVLVVLLYALFLDALEGFDVTALNILFMSAFAALFYCANFGIALVSRRITRTDAITAIAIGFAFYQWVLMVVPASAQAVALAFGAVAFVYGAYTLRHIAEIFAMTVAYVGVACGLLFAATTIVFHGTSLTVFVAVEVSALIMAVVWMARRHLRSGAKDTLRVAVHKGIFALYSIPLVMSLQSVDYAVTFSRSMYDYRGVFGAIDHLIVVVTLSISAFAIAASVLVHLLSGSARGSKGDAFAIGIVRFFGACGAFYASTFVWMGTRMLMGDAVGTFVALVLYTVVGVALYIRGGHEEYVPYKVFGSVFLIAVILRLFVVDFWTMAIGTRVVTFFVVGALFISTAFLARKSDHEKH